MPQNTRGVKYGMPQKRHSAYNAPGFGGTGTDSMASGAGNMESAAGTAGNISVTETGSISAGKSERGTAATAKNTQTGTNTAQKTFRRSHCVSHGNVLSETVAQKADGLGLLFSKDDMLRGFIMAEVLGRPKCLRRGGGMI